VNSQGGNEEEDHNLLGAKSADTQQFVSAARSQYKFAARIVKQLISICPDNPTPSAS
jgi:hypothetical protein